MRRTLEVEVGDDTYEVEVTHFSPPGRYRWGEPPEGGEIELDESTVRVIRGSDLPYSDRPRLHVPFENFLEAYAATRGIDVVQEALPQLQDECYEKMLSEIENDYDDREV